MTDVLSLPHLVAAVVGAVHEVLSGHVDQFAVLEEVLSLEVSDGGEGPAGT